MKIAALVALGAALLSASAASAAEYECRNKRNGTFAGNPISMNDAKAWEDRNAAIDCFRKGVPVTSGRDLYQADRRDEREERWERREERRAVDRDRWTQGDRWDQRGHRDDRSGSWRNRENAPVWNVEPTRPYRAW